MRNNIGALQDDVVYKRNKKMLEVQLCAKKLGCMNPRKFGPYLNLNIYTSVLFQYSGKNRRWTYEINRRYKQQDKIFKAYLDKYFQKISLWYRFKRFVKNAFRY